MKIHIHNLYKSYQNPVFEDFSISFKENEITCILGPSGCGKTTLLHIIGGLIRPDGGVLEGFQDKQLSYVFQDPRLLPWKTVCENIEFVLPKHLHAAERKKQAEQLIKQVELEGFSCYYPAQLSGGMRQRVSIARAFAVSSDIILMDEPLKGLDPILKQNLIQWFLPIWKADRRTVIFVTHDVEEALQLGDTVVVLSKAPARILLQTENNKLEKTDRLKEMLMTALENKESG